MNNDNVFVSIWEAIKDDETRFRVLSCIFAGLVVAVISISFMFYNMFAAKGCKATVAAGDLIGAGIIGLILLGTIWFCVGMLVYGVSYLPELIKDKMEERRSEWHKEMRRADLERFGPARVRMVNWIKENWITVAKVKAVIVGIIVAVIGVAYLLAYIFWCIFC